MVTGAQEFLNSRGGGVPGEPLRIPFGKIGVHLKGNIKGNHHPPPPLLCFFLSGR